MSDVNEWIKERRRIHNAATEGPWEAHGTTAATAWSGAGDYSGPIDDREPVANASPEDVSAIVDAHNTLPNLLTAVEKVLELHKPVPIYDVEAGDCEHGEDCVGIELEPSETYCPDHIAYYSCECMMDASSPDEFPEYPCLTVQAIEGAING